MRCGRSRHGKLTAVAQLNGSLRGHLSASVRVSSFVEVRARSACWAVATPLESRLRALRSLIHTCFSFHSISRIDFEGPQLCCECENREPEGNGVPNVYRRPSLCDIYTVSVIERIAFLRWFYLTLFLSYINGLWLARHYEPVTYPSRVSVSSVILREGFAGRRRGEGGCLHVCE